QQSQGASRPQPSAAPTSVPDNDFDDDIPF
ncbi:MAG: single-stranded DNA-binding protein, partial [Candidatus Thiodiazotropha sp.]|nr:single-stranded DNA-binding protein [Candidatus Thiodiazotropha sp.]MCM8921456.1 single-stranded DNA-binding protein [Candidatus Thiodiazotropha sp.]